MSNDQDPTARIYFPRPGQAPPASQPDDGAVRQSWSTSTPPGPEPAPQMPQMPTGASASPVRRPTRRFLPPAPPEQKETPVVSRDFTRSKRRAKTPELSRKRKIAGDLPSWEPMPPGETLVVRRGER